MHTDMTKVAVPTTGTYAKRANILRTMIEAEITRVFGLVAFEARGEEEEKPCYVWKLPPEVSVSINRYLDADPHVRISRNDPVRKPPGDTDWKTETMDRDYETKAYDVRAIVARAKAFVDHNRKKVDEHYANEEACAKELDGAGEVPKGMTLERDPKTGRYRFWMHTDVPGLTAEEARAALNAARDFRGACPKGRKEESDAE